MHLVLFAVGLAAIATGVVMIGFGIPINEFGLGNTLIGSGTTAIIGGLILIGLSAVIGRLRDVARALERQDARVGGEGTPSYTAAAEPVRASPNTASSIAAEPVVSTDLTWSSSLNDEPMHLPPVQGLADLPNDWDEPVPSVVTRRREPTPSRERPARRSQQLDAGWSRDQGLGAGRHSGGGDALFGSHLDEPPLEVSTASEARRPRRRESSEQMMIRPPLALQTVTVLKSGVIDGMAYTLYSDGSIDAEMTHGMMRFNTIEELRAYMASERQRSGPPRGSRRR